MISEKKKKKKMMSKLPHRGLKREGLEQDADDGDGDQHPDLVFELVQRPPEPRAACAAAVEHADKKPHRSG